MDANLATTVASGAGFPWLSLIVLLPLLAVWLKQKCSSLSVILYPEQMPQLACSGIVTEQILRPQHF